MRCSIEYCSAHAWPFESTKRSRLTHDGSFGLYCITFCQSRWAIGAQPIAAPGWPELACCTMSALSTRTKLI